VCVVFTALPILLDITSLIIFGQEPKLSSSLFNTSIIQLVACCQVQRFSSICLPILSYKRGCDVLFILIT
jgi:hypothetical protein